MDSQSMCNALGLEEPWYIKESNLDTSKGTMNIYIDFRKGTKFSHGDSKELYGVYRTKERTIKHLFMRQYETLLHVRIPEIKTRDGHIHTVEFPLSRAYSGFTYLFEAMVVQFAKAMALSQISNMIKEDTHTIMNIITYYVLESKRRADYSNITNLGVDETSKSKGHSYITSGVNLNTRRVSSIALGKGADTLEHIARDIESHKGNRDNIKNVTMDLSPAFISGCEKTFKNADIIFDKFHIMKLMNEKLDMIRKIETKENKILKGSRFLWLVNQDKLSEDKKNKLEFLKRENSSLALAYQLKLNLQTFFTLNTYQEAESYLKLWCEQAIKSKLRPLADFVKMLRRHRIGIMNYIIKRLTNGILEGINSVIQGIKKRARGYRNFDNFMTMVYLHLGDFSISTVTY